MSEPSATRARRLSPWDWLLAPALALLWLGLARPAPLSVPYFWDEADVYVPGSIWVAEHGLDVSPGVFPDDYSRGHPPLLYLLAGAAFRIAGPGPSVGHALVLPFAALALAGTYWLGALCVGRAAGLGAAALLATTPLFLSISSMLLPEGPLTALAVLSLVALARGRLGLAALAGTAAALTKETGIFAPLAIAGALTFEAARERRLFRRRALGEVGVSLLPVAALAAFFVWQRLSPAGYFVFPHHQGMLLERPFGPRDLATALPSLLLWHGRWALVAAAAIAVALRLRGRARAAPREPRPTRTRTVALAALLLVLGNALFFAKMFWLERYALPAHPGLLVLLVAPLLAPWPGRRPWPTEVAASTVVLACAAMGLAGTAAPTRPNEEELTFAWVDVVETHRAAYEALAEEAGPDPLVVTAWPMTVELRNPVLGYVDRPFRTVHVDAAEGLSPGAVSAVLAPIRSRHAEPLRAVAARLGLRPAGRYQVGRAPALELYVR